MNNIILKKAIFLLIFLLPVVFLSAQSFKYKKSKKGYYFKNEDGVLNKEKVYKQYRSFSNGIAIVKANDKWGALDKKGNVIVPFQYDELWNLQKQVRCRIGDKIGLLDNQGNELVPIKYEWVEAMNNGKSLVKIDNQWKWLNQEGLSEYIDESVEDIDEYILVDNCVDEDEPKKCTNKRLLETIYRNVRYSPEGRQNGIQGTVKIELIFNKEGKIERKVIKEGLGYGLDEEAIRALDRINDLNLSPAKKDGKKVKYKLIFPIKFRLA